MSSDFQLIKLGSAEQTAALYPYGAHLISWQVAGHEQLFTSSSTELRSGAAIRGGVPIVFPQFANRGVLPKHGFARTALWRVLSEGPAQVKLQWHDDELTRANWPQQFSAEYVVSLSEHLLSMTLTIRNLGAPLSFTAALHTYLRVADIAQVSVMGLQGVRYSDSADGGIDKVQSDASLRIVGEVDRIYFSTPQPITVTEPGRVIECMADGFTDTVIWNPGVEKAAALTDLEADGYNRMLCVEAAVIGAPVQLETGASWSGTQHLRLR